MTKSLIDGKVHTYDIINCGPRNRFVVNGKIVSNSGQDSINVQNLPKGSTARTAIEAPKGHVIIAVDSAQIELRVNAWFSGEHQVLEKVRNGVDLYLDLAHKKFDPTATKESPIRQLCKAITLGSGFGMGAARFKDWVASGPMGIPPIHLSDAEALASISAYRAEHPNIVKQWKDNEAIIKDMMRKNTHAVVRGCICVEHEQIILPNGMPLLYWGLHCEETSRGPQYLYGGMRYVKGVPVQDTHYLHGALLQENIVQALARVVITDQLVEIERQGIRTVSTTHDEIIAIAPEHEADSAMNEMIRIMSTSPNWATDLPLGAEGAYEKYYCK